MQLTIIAALDDHHAIGRGNTMPWHLPADLQRFKRLTMQQFVVMGRRTAESIGRALPKRRNLVLTRSGQAPFPGQEVVGSLQEAMALAHGASRLWVLGGAEVYAQALPLASELHLTHVAASTPDADTFFPEFDVRDWEVVSEESYPADATHAHPYRFTHYRRARLPQLHK
jgi:dihydrofolate reductase